MFKKVEGISSGNMDEVQEYELHVLLVSFSDICV